MSREPMEDPYPETPGERERTVEEVRSTIRSTDKFPFELRSELEKHAAEFVKLVVKPGSGRFYGGQLGWSSWVIRNDSLRHGRCDCPSGFCSRNVCHRG